MVKIENEEQLPLWREIKAQMRRTDQIMSRKPARCVQYAATQEFKWPSAFYIYFYINRINLSDNGVTLRSILPASLPCIIFIIILNGVFSHPPLAPLRATACLRTYFYFRLHRALFPVLGVWPNFFVFLFFTSHPHFSEISEWGGGITYVFLFPGHRSV